MLSTAFSFLKNCKKLGSQNSQLLNKIRSKGTRNTGITYINDRRFCFRSSACWNCGTHISTSMFCYNCKVLQEPDTSLNYFDIMGIKKVYDIETNDLVKKYRSLQNVLHPDKYGQKTKEELQISEKYSSLINDAYSTLNHPLARGLYLLKLEGILIEEEQLQSQQEFLLKIMETNEEIEDTKTIYELDSLDASNKRILEDLAREASKAFNRNNFGQAKEILTKMKYYATIDSKIKKKREELGF